MQHEVKSYRQRQKCGVSEDHLSIKLQRKVTCGLFAGCLLLDQGSCFLGHFELVYEENGIDCVC